MNSVQLSSSGLNQRRPRFRQPINLLGLGGMRLGNALQHDNLVGHHRKVGNGPLPCPGHIRVSGQSLAGDHNALIGLGWGHGGNVPEGSRPW